MERYTPWMGQVVKILGTWLLVLTALKLSAQQINKIDFVANGIPIEKAIQLIGDQNGFTYSFNPTLFEGHALVNGTFRNKSPQYVFQQIIAEPSIGVKRMGNAFVFFAKQPYEVTYTGSVKDYRSKKGIEAARLALKDANISTLTSESGNYQLKYSTYQDSIKLYLFHEEFEEKEVF